MSHQSSFLSPPSLFSVKEEEMKDLERAISFLEEAFPGMRVVIWSKSYIEITIKEDRLVEEVLFIQTLEKAGFIPSRIIGILRKAFKMHSLGEKVRHSNSSHESNVIYLGAKLDQSGNLVGGRKWKAVPEKRSVYRAIKELSELNMIDDQHSVFVENVSLDKNGGFAFLRKLRYWGERQLLKQKVTGEPSLVTVRVKPMIAAKDFVELGIVKTLKEGEKLFSYLKDKKYLDPKGLVTKVFLQFKGPVDFELEGYEDQQQSIYQALDPVKEVYNSNGEKIFDQNQIEYRPVTVVSKEEEVAKVSQKDRIYPVLKELADAEQIDENCQLKLTDVPLDKYGSLRLFKQQGYWRNLKGYEQNEKTMEYARVSVIIKPMVTFVDIMDQGITKTIKEAEDVLSYLKEKGYLEQNGFISEACLKLSSPKDLSLDKYDSLRHEIYQVLDPVKEVYDALGKKIFPFENNIVHLDAKIDDDGNIVGGRKWKSIRDKSKVFRSVKELGDILSGGENSLVIEGVSLDVKGGLRFLRQEPYWRVMKEYRADEGTGECAKVNIIMDPVIFPKCFLNLGIVETEREAKELYGFLKNKGYVNSKGWVTDLFLSLKNSLELEVGNFVEMQQEIYQAIDPVKAVYDEQGKKLYPVQDNVIYLGANMDESGKRIGGKKWKAIRTKRKMYEGLKDLLKSGKSGSEKRMIVEEVSLDAKGGLAVLRKKPYWRSLEGYRQKKNGELAKVALVIKMVVTPEDFIDSKVVKNRKEALALFAYLSGKGYLEENGFIGAAFLKISSVSRFDAGPYKDKSQEIMKLLDPLKEVYDRDGKRLFPLEDAMVYVGAGIDESGLIIEGKAALPVANFELKRIFRENPEAVVEKKLTVNGALWFFRRNYWSRTERYRRENPQDGVKVLLKINFMVSVKDFLELGIVDTEAEGERLMLYLKQKGYLNAKGRISEEILAFKTSEKLDLGVYSDRRHEIYRALDPVKEIYEKGGRKIYPFEENVIYFDAGIGEDGKREGGQKWRAVSVKRNTYAVLEELSNENPTACQSVVMENVPLNYKGGLWLMRKKPYWRNNHKLVPDVQTGEHQKVTVKLTPVVSSQLLIERGVVETEENARELFSYLIKKRYLKENGLVTFEFLSIEDPTYLVLDQYEYLRDKIYMALDPVRAAYDEEGNEIYVRENEMSRYYVFYQGARIDEWGRITGGKKVAMISDKKLEETISRFPNAIILKDFPGDGSFGFLGQRYWGARKEYAKDPETGQHAKAMIQMLDGKLHAVFDESGKMIYEAENGKTRQFFNELVEAGDIEKLIFLFGLSGTNRLLIRLMKGGGKSAIVRYNTLFIKEMPLQKRQSLRRKKSKYSTEELVKTLNDLTVLRRLETKNDVEQAAETLIPMVYQYFVHDARFLKILKQEVKSERSSEFLRQCLKKIIEYYERPTKDNYAGIKTFLKFYQVKGIDFILNRKRVILGDEPGLGKTLQVLTASVNANAGDGAKKTLIISPHVSKANVWKKQIESHLFGEPSVFVIQSRNQLLTQRGMKKLVEAKFVIVNYELLRGDSEDVRTFRKLLKATGLKGGYDFIAVDEAHHLRNDSLTMKAVSEFDAPYKVLVTGTPMIGKRVQNLFNLLHWLKPEKYKDRKSFSHVFGKKKGEGAQLLNEAMDEEMIRRYADDVLVDLPELEVEVIVSDMSKDQAEIYRRVREQGGNRDMGASLIRAAISGDLVYQITLKNQTTHEEMVCEPGVKDFQLNGALYSVRREGMEYILSCEGEKIAKGRKNIFQIESGRQIFQVHVGRMKSNSNKFLETDRLVNDVVRNKKQSIVLFSGSVEAVERLRERYAGQGYPGVQAIYGDIPKKKREAIIESFNEGETPAILICTYQTLGESIALTGASHGILIDCPWLFQKKEQIIRRLFRLGQKSKVHFWLLTSRNTIDERIQDIMMEEDLLQQIVLAEDKMEEEDGFLLDMIRSEMDDSGRMLSQLMEKTRKQGAEREEDNIYEQSCDGHFFISFRERNFRAVLKDSIGGDLFIENVKSLFEKASELSASSKSMMKDFFTKRFSAEIEASVRVKEMLLWSIMEGLVDGFENIDYNLNLEMMVEAGSYILRRLIEDPSLDVDTLKKELPVREPLVDKVLDYFETANIFKLFSLLGIIPPKYYVEGKLLDHSSMIEVYYQMSKIYYSDEGRVEAIAPDWENRINQKERLTREEEIGLSRQLERGNRFVEQVFGYAFHKEFRSLAYRAKRIVESKFHSVTIDPGDLESVAREVFINCVRDYAAHRVYLRMSLKEYLTKNMSPKVYSAAYRIAEIQLQELEIEDPITDRTRAIDRSQEELIADNEIYDTLRKVLLQGGFNSSEIEMLIFHLRDDYTPEEIALQTGAYLNTVLDLLARFREYMEYLGMGKVSRLLSGNEELFEEEDTKIFDQVLDLLNRLKTADQNSQTVILRHLHRVLENLKHLHVSELTCCRVLERNNVAPHIVKLVLEIVYGDLSIDSLNVDELFCSELPFNMAV